MSDKKGVRGVGVKMLRIMSLRGLIRMKSCAAGGLVLALSIALGCASVTIEGGEDQRPDGGLPDMVGRDTTPSSGGGDTGSEVGTLPGQDTNISSDADTDVDTDIPDGVRTCTAETAASTCGNASLFSLNSLFPMLNYPCTALNVQNERLFPSQHHP